MKMKKNMTGAHASCTFRKLAKCQNDSKSTNAKKMLMKTRKNIIGPHASVYFENGPNAKNSHENEKMYDRTTCFRVFPKWAKCQKLSRKRENK